MVLFFDLNVPFLEGDDRASAQENSARKAARLKVVVKAMELGYSGVAYNRTIRGVMSDSDCCKIPYFSLSSLLEAAPTLYASVGFHRELLGVPSSAPFRQYTRLTFGVDSAVAAAGLNSGNPVLRTYDLVAVRPLNQVAFDQACKVSQVDLIAIDFSQKLPFRLKLPMVRAAIERGVYFEITYSHLISDVHMRRQMLQGAKLLVDWTRGKNLIFSSAAPTVKELRGPYDIANLSSLFGLSMERAKAAISRNCRSLVTNALRKKHCYKEAIRIEKIPPDKQLDSNQAWFGDWNNWDPLSSEEGDLPSLDDIAKHFSVASRVPKNFSAIDFDSVADGISSKDWIFSDGENLVVAGGKASSVSPTREPQPSSTANEAPQKDRLDGVPFSDMTPLVERPSEHQFSGFKGDLVSPCDTVSYFSDTKESSSIVAEERDVSNSNGFVVPIAAGIPSYDTPSKDCIPTYEGKLESLDDSPTLFSFGEEIRPSDVCREDPESSDRVDCTSCIGANQVTSNDFETSYTNSMEIDTSFAHNEDDKRLSGLGPFLDACNVPAEQVFACGEESGKIDSVLDECNVPVEQVFACGEESGKIDSVLDAYDVLLQEDLPKNDLSDQGDGVMPSTDDMLFEEALDQKNLQEQGDVVSIANDVPLNESMVKLEGKEQEGSPAANGVRRQKFKTGKNRFRQRLPGRAVPFPFKRLLNPLLFKKKVPQFKESRKHLFPPKIMKKLVAVDFKTFELEEEGASGRFQITERGQRSSRRIYLNQERFCWIAKVVEDLIQSRHDKEKIWKIRDTGRVLIGKLKENDKGRFLCIDECFENVWRVALCVPEGPGGRGWLAFFGVIKNFFGHILAPHSCPTAGFGKEAGPLIPPLAPSSFGREKELRREHFPPLPDKRLSPVLNLNELALG